MTFDNNLLNHLNEIIILIENEKINGENEAIEKFKNYTDTVQLIGKFNIENWNVDWRKRIWNFGELFNQQNPILFLNIIDDKLNLLTTTNKEVLEFIRSEIIFSFLPDNECKKQLEKLIETYSYNPEFRHTLGHYYKEEQNYLLAIEEYKLALKIEPANKDFLKHRFNAEWEYLNDILKKGEYQIGKDYVSSIFTEKVYFNGTMIFHNAFVDLNQRLEDHILFQKKLFSLENDFKEKMKSELESERKRIIEILGFFSAIMAFILSTVSIGGNFSFSEAIYFIITLGIILILFVSTLSTLFTTSDKKTIKTKNFWILVIGLILMFLMIINIDKIKKATESLKNKTPIKTEKLRVTLAHKRFGQEV